MTETKLRGATGWSTRWTVEVMQVTVTICRGRGRRSRGNLFADVWHIGMQYRRRDVRRRRHIG